MAQISITIPDALLAKAVEALSQIPYPPWSATLPDGSPNPETKAQFAKAVVAKFIRDAMRAKQVRELQEAAVAVGPLDDLSGIT